ncbi:MAG: ABC transporter ATP-binding protein [Firmicutes bacterium]|nr:ABC transporter ATP-binding protein [Bacillota bacterium]
MFYLKRLMNYSRRYHKVNLLGLGLALVAIVLGLVKPYLTKMIVDDVLVAGNYELFTKLALIFLGMTLLRVIAQYFKSYIFQYTSQGVLYDLRSDLFRRLLRQSFSFFDQERTGLLMNRLVGDLRAVRMFLNMGYVQAFEAAVTLLFTVIVMLRLNMPLTLSLLVMLPFLYLTTRSMSRQLRPVFRSIRTAFENLNSYVQENITGIQVVKASGREEDEKARFKEVAGDLTENHLAASEIRAKYVPFNQFISGAGALVILLVGGYFVMEGEITIGVLVAFNGYMLSLRHPINSIAGLVNQWVNAQASLEKVFDLMDEEIKVANRENPLVLSAGPGRVEVKDVSFSYVGEPVLQDISFTMEPGTTTAIVGDTGSGKTTIINLLARFYDVTDGQITYDGHDLRDVDLDSLRRKIGVVMQDTFLFSDTIANNIAFARPDATREEIEQAARIADAHEFISQLPEGYDTVVGERGTGLSGGQKQRVAIARALVSDPQILVLDDSTSSVDMETEQSIQQALSQARSGRTTLIIAYRISSVKDADQILVLDQGRIIERGTHLELVKKRGKYYRTLLEQYNEYHKFAGEGRGA